MQHFIITAKGWIPTPENKFIAGRSATVNAVEPQVCVSSSWQGKDASYRAFKIWQNEGWSREWMQKLVNGQWVSAH
jgi:hypothetical protein